MSTLHRLYFFEVAQEETWEEAMNEIRAGRKQTHWMWFIFPQLRSLGTSVKSRLYGIASLEEAHDFVAHPILGPRLQQSIREVLNSPTQDVNQLFGHTDAIKLLSCLTLFELVPQTASLCNQALLALYGGRRDPRTLELLQIS